MQTVVMISEGPLGTNTFNPKLRFTLLKRPIIILSGCVLNKNVTIRIPYLDSDNDGIEDVSNINLSGIKIYYQDEGGAGNIFPFYGSVKIAASYIEVLTDHLSTWIAGDERWESNSTINCWHASFPTNDFV